MARAYTKKKRTVGKRKGGMRRRRGFRKARDVPEYASLSVRRSITDEGGALFATNQMYDFRNIDLNSYDRAVIVAQAYQHYRIKKVTLTLKPTYDTYQQAAGAGSRPQLYYMIDKSGSIPDNVTIEALKQMGAKPIRFDEKPISISWRPSVLTSDNVAPGVQFAAQYKISPWLSTSRNPLVNPWAPSQVDHLGLFWFVEQLFVGGVQYSADVEVQFQFKKPLRLLVTGEAAKKVQVAQVNDSKDGIVGGPDGV